MKISSHPLGNNVPTMLSITDSCSDGSICKNPELVMQKPQMVSIHNPEKKWLLVSSEVGYFNKITQFICGEVSSLLFLNVNGELEYPSISEVKQNPQKYFMLYPLPFSMFEDAENNEIILNWESKKFNKTWNNSEKIKLDFDLGFETGKAFFNYTNNKNLSKFHEAINGSDNPEYFWPHKNIILNSNIEFLFGILFGYFNVSSDKFAHDDVSIKDKLYIGEGHNTYIFSTILNWLGASYSFQNVPKVDSLYEDTNINSSMKMFITLPHSLLGAFNKICKLNPTISEFRKIFKSHEWYLTGKNKIRKLPIGTKEKSKSNYNTLVDSGKMRIVPMSCFKFIDVSEKEKNLEMYDFTMPRADATNYAIGFTPILKNSDGDILTMSAIYGREAIEDAKAFEPTHKEWFRNLNNGEINNYIADDAILGLYAATKFL